MKAGQNVGLFKFFSGGPPIPFLSRATLSFSFLFSFSSFFFFLSPSPSPSPPSPFPKIPIPGRQSPLLEYLSVIPISCQTVEPPEPRDTNNNTRA